MLIIDLIMTPSAITPCEVSALEHELCDHSVELGALVAKALLPCTQGPKKRHRFKSECLEHFNKT